MPHVVEEFLLTEDGAGTTRLEYRGEMAADLWQLGRLHSPNSQLSPPAF